MKKTALILLMVFSFVVVTAAFAEANLNWKKGKHYFKNKCLNCHDSATQIHPKTKKRTEWEKFFSDKEHPEDSWANISDEEIQNVAVYFERYSKDSDMYKEDSSRE